MNKGFIKLNRKFFETEYWKQKRTFSLAEAWLDLIQLARFEADPQQKTLKNGREITVKRGEIHASLRYLSNRWGWSVGKVKRFISKSIEKHQTEHRTEQGETVLRLCKYGHYNDNKIKTEYQTEHQTEHRRNTDGTPIDTPTEQNKEYKELKEGKEIEKIKNFQTFKSQIGEDEQWIEIFYMKYRTKKNTLIKIINEFNKECLLKEKSHNSLKDYKEHLLNWCNVQDRIGNLDKYKFKKKTTPKRQVGDI